MAVTLGAPRTATSNAPISFAAEILEGSGGVHTINHSTLLTGTTALGPAVGVVNRSNDIYIRADVGGVLRLTGAPANNRVTIAGVGIGNQNQTSPGVGGRTRDQHLIHVVASRGASSASTDVFSLNLAFVAAVSDIGEGTLRVRIHDDIRDAVAATGDPLLDKGATLVSMVRSVSVKALKASQTATVESGFTQFAPGGSPASAADTFSIAQYNVAVACLLDPNGSALNNCTPGSTTPRLSDVNVKVSSSHGDGGSTVVISGDGGFAFAKTIAQFPGAALDTANPNHCEGTGLQDDGEVTFPQKDGEDDKAGPVTGLLAGRLVNLCVTVDEKSTERIAAGQYLEDFNFVASDSNKPFPPMSVEDLVVGEIKRDGTSVDIPFLTSHDGYTQRLVIVNRNKDDVAYTLTLHTEGDGTADPMIVEGMAMGGGTTTLKVADEVTFTSPTRGAGTLDIVSSPAKVDVATTMVNQGDQSTDTVVLHLGKRDMNNR